MLEAVALVDRYARAKGLQNHRVSISVAYLNARGDESNADFVRTAITIEEPNEDMHSYNGYTARGVSVLLTADKDWATYWTDPKNLAKAFESVDIFCRDKALRS